MKKFLIIILILVIYLQAYGPVPWLPVMSHTSRIIEETFNNQLSVKLPQSTKVMAIHFSDKRELMHSVYFDDEKLLFRGYIQLWKINDVESFLVTSRELSTFDFKYSFSDEQLDQVEKILSSVSWK